MTTAGFLSRIRRVVAGDTFDGLRWTEEMASVAASLTVERALALRREVQAVLAEIRDDQETALAQHRERIAKECKRVWEAGRGGTVEDNPNKSPELLAVLAKWAGKAVALGCPIVPAPDGSTEPHIQHVLGHFTARLKVLNDELGSRFRRDGEPREVVALRKRIAEARKAEWPLRKALKDARERLNAIGVHLAEGEVVAAVRDLAVAEGKTQVLLRELGEWPVPGERG